MTKDVDSGLPQLRKAHMPADYSISLAQYTRGGTDRFLAEGRDDMPAQSMRGFEDQYRNIIDYIVRITHRIWEEKDIGYIYDTYAHNSRVYDDYGLQYGRDKIVADTTHTINAFPNIRLVADEIIWAGDEDVGFYTSHRTIIQGDNTGYSRYGPPTGKRVSLWCIANCVSRENEIFLEHVLYNTSAMLRQMGLDLGEVARQMAEAGGSALPDDYTAGEPARQQGQAKPACPSVPEASGELDVEDFIRSLYQRVWNRRMLGTLQGRYADNLVFNGPTDRAFSGLGPYQAFVLSLLAQFPDLALDVDEVYWMGNPDEGYLVSTRWNAYGAHRGNGVFGPPTGREARIRGITQHRIEDGRVTEEWMLFNELDVMMQLLGARPSDDSSETEDGAQDD